MKKVLKIKISDEKIFLEYQKKKKSFSAPRRQSEKLLRAIRDFVDIHSLEAIEINNEGASFTALRVGVSTVNALAYALNLEVIPSNKKHFFKLQNKKYAQPCYDH